LFDYVLLAYRGTAACAHGMGGLRVALSGAGEAVHIRCLALQGHGPPTGLDVGSRRGRRGGLPGRRWAAGPGARSSPRSRRQIGSPRWQRSPIRPSCRRTGLLARSDRRLLRNRRPGAHRWGRLPTRASRRRTGLPRLRGRGGRRRACLGRCDPPAVDLRAFLIALWLGDRVLGSWWSFRWPWFKARRIIVFRRKAIIAFRRCPMRFCVPLSYVMTIDPAAAGRAVENAAVLYCDGRPVSAIGQIEQQGCRSTISGGPALRRRGCGCSVPGGRSCMASVVCRCSRVGRLPGRSARGTTAKKRVRRSREDEPRCWPGKFPPPTARSMTP
jgi:hypothetical protein